jgi:hypothetical protein
VPCTGTEPGIEHRRVQLAKLVLPYNLLVDKGQMLEKLAKMSAIVVIYLIRKL